VDFLLVSDGHVDSVWDVNTASGVGWSLFFFFFPSWVFMGVWGGVGGNYLFFFFVLFFFFLLTITPPFLPLFSFF